MRQPIIQAHRLDSNSNPAGGTTVGLGFEIVWQDGATKERGPGGEVELGRNGAFVEEVIEAAIGRLEFYQSSRFECDDNALAIAHLRSALDRLDARTTDRQVRGVEGKHVV